LGSGLEQVAREGCKSISEYIYSLAYVEELEDRTARKELDRDRAEEQVKEGQVVYTQASIECKVLDQLKEKRRLDYSLEELRREQKTLDDLAQTAYIRNGKGE
jgi:flagellar export protein FliJ